MDEQQDPKQMLTSIWSLDAAGELDPDENCSPTKQCRNTKDMTFDGYAPEETIKLSSLIFRNYSGI